MLQNFESIKEAVGVDIPKILKDITTGGLVGKAAPDVSEG
jgi:flotillin